MKATLALDEAARRTWDAVVIGAGPAGSTAALLLARENRRVLLVERKAFPRYKVCGGCLSATGVALLDHLGLGNALREAGAQPLHQLRLHAGSHVAALRLPGGVSVSRAALDELLAEAAVEAGAHFLPETHAEVVDRGAYHVELHATSRLREPVLLAPTVILVADGLGHPSSRSLPRFTEKIHPAARIGAGCLFRGRLAGVSPNAVTMVIARQGYVGLVEDETGGICLGAALDACFVREQHGMANACQFILDNAGFPTLEIDGTHWTGTPALTRQTLSLADRNVLLLGDAGGYVEPFTGEGMVWALQSACDVVPHVFRLLEGIAVDRAWNLHIQAARRQRQQWCRAITAGLRWPSLPSACVRMLSAAPVAAAPIVRWITDRPPPVPLKLHP